ncbi:MAG: helix-turn-helix transcriptional regulator [Luteolibacter sp.]|uniref:helix-turn-helix domain-containing protein n=1 Tax=Luteolibacter sp. TaxID=1962973 RepID=UPI003263112D
MESETVRTLLKRLKALRVARGLTQEQFAEQSGISYKYYQAVEAGRKQDLRLSTLDRLATAHGMEVWQLLAPDNAPVADGETGKPRARRTK